jgi:hypothetical protein
LEIEIKFAFSVVWKHANYRLIFSDDWEWTDNVSDDLLDGFGDFLEEMESGTDPRILEGLQLRDNWTMLSSGKSTYAWKYVDFDVLDKEKLIEVLPARHLWNDEYGSCTYIVPWDFEVEKWGSLSRYEKLEAMDQNEDGSFSGFNNEGYFDFYVIGQVEAVALVEASSSETAQEVFLNQFNEYAAKSLPSALSELMPDPEILEMVDESVSLEYVPNWLYIEKLEE